MFHTGEVGQWQATGHCSPEIQRDTVHIRHLPVQTPPSSANQRRSGSVEQKPKHPGCHARHPLHLRPSCPRLCQAGFEGPQCCESLSWVELGLHDQNIGCHIQGHHAPHPQLRCPRLVHPNILNPPGQA